MLNEKYSYKDYMNKELSEEKASDFNDTEIIGSCFYQEGDPDQEIFPVGITGVNFIRCNLDNVKLPAGCTVFGGTNKKIKIQNDLSDWILDKDGNPTEPIDKKDREEAGISCDPKDIPVTKLDTPLLSAEVT